MKKRKEQKSNKWTIISWTIFALFLLALIISLAIFQQYKQAERIKQLDVDLVSATIDEIKLTSVKIGLTFSIHNPNKKDVTIGNFTAKVSTNDKTITDITLPQFTLPAQKTTLRTIKFRVNYLDLGVAAIESIRQKQANWQVQGKYYLQLPFGIQYPYEFNIEKTYSADKTSST